MLYTDPAKIVNFQTPYVVDAGQSLTLNCEVAGNPLPTHSWTPCNDSEQVCHKNTLHISQVCEDANYTCIVANGLRNDTKRANVCKLLFSLTHLLLNSGRFFLFLEAVLNW